VLLLIGAICEPWGNTAVREKKTATKHLFDVSLLFFVYGAKINVSQSAVAVCVISVNR